MLIIAKQQKRVTYSSLYLSCVLFTNYSYATTSKMVHNQFFYSIQQGKSPLDKTNQLSSLPIPKMDGISDYVKNHNNSLPDTWGFEQTSTPSTYSQLGFPALGTQLICRSKNGCSGEIKIARYNKNISGIPTSIALQIKNNNTQVTNYFVIDDNKNSINEVYFLIN